MPGLVPPHGGGSLKPLLLEGAALAAEKKRAQSLPRVRVSSREKGDLIMLDHDIFSALGLGVLSLSAFKAGAATSSSHHLLYNQATGDLSYDYDGSGSAAAVQIATLNPGTALNMWNFFVV